MEIQDVGGLSGMKRKVNKKKDDKRKDKEPFIEERKERGKYDFNTKESCINCKHRMGGPICLKTVDDDREFKNTWCKLYTPKEDKGTIICEKCELKDTCVGITSADKCVKFIKEEKKEQKLEELAKEGTLKVKRID